MKDPINAQYATNLFNICLVYDHMYGVTPQNDRTSLTFTRICDITRICDLLPAQNAGRHSVLRVAFTDIRKCIQV